MNCSLNVRSLVAAAGTAAAIFWGATNLHATVADLEALQSANPNLWHQYKFEGIDDLTRLADTATTGDTSRVHLARTVGEGSVDVNMTPMDTSDDVFGLPEDITFENGVDGALSQAYRPSYVDPALAANAGAGLTGTAMQIPAMGITVEAVVKPDAKASPSDVNYIVMTRPGGDRGYLLVQDDTDLGRAMVGSLGSIYGNAFGNRIETTEYDDTGDWFYVAATFDLTPTGSATVNTYFANLTAGDPGLTHVGMDVSLSADDAYEGLIGNLGIGAFAVERTGDQTDGAEAVQEFFQGAIDNVAIYSTAASASELGQRYGALSMPIPEPATVSLLILGAVMTIFRIRR